MESIELVSSPSQDTDTKTLSIASLSLNHFRNYTHVRLETTGEPVVLTGRNGAGKTNILEAISLLTPGRGIRRAKISEIDNRNDAGQAWSVAANLTGMRGDIKVGTGRDPANTNEINEKRIIRIDEKPARNQAELARHFAIIWLTPQMEQLFQEGASAARKFLDRLVYSFDPEHAARINEYDFAMRERNKLLQYDRPDAVWMEALEQTMAETGAAIANARIHTVEHLNSAIQQSELSFPKAHIIITGMIEDLLKLGTPAVQIEEDFKSILKAGRRQDAAAGRTLSGVHRSEMRVNHVLKQMPAEVCSTGEQKALLLSMVLAQARAGAQWHGVVPVLLLDEVIAHLDATRRLELFEEICQIGAQTWMTGTDIAPFAELKGKAQYYQIDNGHVIAS